jgi:hypothetical protein
LQAEESQAPTLPFGPRFERVSPTNIFILAP